MAPTALTPINAVLIPSSIEGLIAPRRKQIVDAQISPDVTVITVAINNTIAFAVPFNFYVTVGCDENLRLRKIASDGTLNTVLVASSESSFPWGMTSY